MTLELEEVLWALPSKMQMSTDLSVLEGVRGLQLHQS